MTDEQPTTVVLKGLNSVEAEAVKVAMAMMAEAFAITKEGPTIEQEQNYMYRVKFRGWPVGGKND